jgi:hypothetical protein
MHQNGASSGMNFDPSAWAKSHVVHALTTAVSQEKCISIQKKRGKKKPNTKI